uniref:Kazal-like domain-containing protein n=1 Tax=Glossina austeni TaxID=7395 RepID=A0A1A9V339_GLOAU
MHLCQEPFFKRLVCSRGVASLANAMDIDDQVTCDDVSCGPKQVCLKDLLTHKPRCSPCRYKCSRKRHSTTHYRFEESKICGVNNRTYNSWCEMRKDSCATGFYIDLKHAECEQRFATDLNGFKSLSNSLES